MKEFTSLRCEKYLHKIEHAKRRERASNKHVNIREMNFDKLSLYVELNPEARKTDQCCYPYFHL